MPGIRGSRNLKAGIDVRQLFEAHADFVWRVLARAGVHDANLEDALQEVFIIVSNKLPQLGEHTRPTTWLYGIAIRVAANSRRKVQRKREDFTGGQDEDMTVDARETPEQMVERAETRAALAALLDRLGSDQRIVFEMFELEEMTCPTIAETLGIPLGTVYTRLRAARTALSASAEELRER